jgi:hypothetical protein
MSAARLLTRHATAGLCLSFEADDSSLPSREKVAILTESRRALEKSGLAQLPLASLTCRSFVVNWTLAVSLEVRCARFRGAAIESIQYL